MHSTLVRGQNVFGFFTTVACIVAVLIASSVVFFPQSPSASVSVKNVQVVKGRPHYYSTQKEEYAYIKFDLDADLSSLFNWNTKQLFVYVVANFPSASSQGGEQDSHAVVWDTIIEAPATRFPFDVFRTGRVKAPKKSSRGKQQSFKSKSERKGVLHLHDQRAKYQITDPSGMISNRANVTLEVQWNIQPWIGVLRWTNAYKLGRWEALQGGKSEVFRFPAIKSKRPDRSTEASPLA